LTSRLRAVCEEFRIVVHQNRFEKVCPDETFLLSNGNGATAFVREVSLVCDGVPLVFGHSILMTRELKFLAQSFRQAGNNSIGAILFACPDIRRGPIYFKRINRQHALHARSVAALGEHPKPFFWARRSIFSLRSEQVCVTEVFSPELVMRSARSKQRHQQLLPFNSSSLPPSTPLQP
jgi:chorismate--pyruvate lyase